MKKKTKLQKFISFIEKGNNWLWVSLAVIIVCFVVIPVLVVNISASFISEWFIYDSNTADIANTIGGIASPLVALVAVVLTFIAFYIQFQANEQQNLNFKIQQFESSFFELLRLHKEIVETVEINGKKGRLSFKEPNEVIRVAYRVIQEIAREVQGRNTDKGRGAEVFCRPKRDEYAFKLVYYGRDSSELYDQLANLYFDFGSPGGDPEDLPQAVKASYNTSLHRVFPGGDSSVPSVYTHHGIRFPLSPYFSHLYHIINFVHTREFLNTNQKKFYVEILVNQISPDEQVTLFYYSISTLAEEWKELIEEYSLIKNVPFIPDFYFLRHPNSWYPNIKYANPPSYINVGGMGYYSGAEDDNEGLYC